MGFTALYFPLRRGSGPLALVLGLDFGLELGSVDLRLCAGVDDEVSQLAAPAHRVRDRVRVRDRG